MSRRLSLFPYAGLEAVSVLEHHLQGIPYYTNLQIHVHIVYIYAYINKEV